MNETPRSADGFTAIAIEVSERIATIELCRPEVMNRFDHELHEQFAGALTSCAHDDNVLAVVLQAAGKVFSAGGSTDLMKDAAGPLPRRMMLVDQGRELFRTVCDFPKPLVIALEGDAYGLGATIALMGDAIVTHPTVKIADTHVVMGLVAGDGGLVSWPQTVGMAVAKRHLLTGDPLRGERAYQLGAVTDLVDTRNEVRAAARAIAARMASLPPMAVQLTKRGFNKLQHARVDDVFDYGFLLEAMSFGTDDLQEAVLAFLEKRPGVWRGQ
jgi:enoyl-CoA hydratase